MLRAFLLAAGLFAVGSAAQLKAAPPDLVSVRAIRYWTLGQSTRIAIDLSGETRFKYERLHDPERLFVDVMESRSAIGEKAYQTIKVGDNLVRQVRVAQKDGRTVRIVLDLECPVDHEISLLANPNRIMVEVRARGSAGSVEVTRGRTGGERIESAAGRPAEPAAMPPAPEKPKPQAVTQTAPSQKSTPPPAVAVPPSAPPVPAGEPAAPAPKEVAMADAAPRAESRPVETKQPPSQPTERREEPKAPRATRSGPRSLSRALGLKIGRVVLDPGHGGNDHGTTGPSGLTEKELVLDLSTRLGALIEQRMGSEVVYTRTTDTYVGLEERTALANERRADLFLSIHANSSPLRGISGAEVYYLNLTTSREALDLAARENAGHGKSIFELREMIQKIALTDKLDESREFATRLQAALSSAWSRMNASAKNRGVKKAPFVVLTGAAMPSVLAEIGFLSNARDEALMRKPDQRQRVAEALYKGIEQYVSGIGQVRAAQGRPESERGDQSAR